MTRRCKMGAVLIAAATTSSAWGEYWVGLGGAPFNWSNPANWQNNALPSNNGTAQVQFKIAAGTTSIVNQPWSLDSIIFSSIALPWSVSGETLTLRTGIIQDNAQGATLSNSLVLAPTTGTTTFTTNVSTLNLSTTSATLSLGSSALALSTASGTQINIQHSITGTGALIKSGLGTVNFTGSSTANTYSGPTRVNAGLLNLARTTPNPSGGASISGSLILNSGVVQISAAEQIADTSPVQIGASGILNILSVTEYVNSLTLAPGAQIIGTGAIGIRPAGGTVSVTGSGVATIATGFHSSATAQTIHVSDGSLLNFTGPFATQGSLNKAGPGAMHITGNFSPAGAVHLQDGYTFLAPSNAGFLSSSSPLVVGQADGSANAQLQLTSASPFGSNASLTLFPNSVVSISTPTPTPANLALGSLTLHQGSSLTLGSNITLTPSGPISFVTNADGIHVAFSPAAISLGNTPQTINVGFSAPAINNFHHARLATRLTSTSTGGLVKTGNGRLFLTATSGSSIASLAINEGTLILGSGSVPPLVPGSRVTVQPGSSLSLETLAANGAIIPTLNNSTLSLSGAFSQPIPNLTLNSGRVNLFGGSAIHLNTNSSPFGSSTFTITASQLPGAPVPEILSYHAGPALTIPDGGSLNINVTTTSNAASTSTGDLNLYARIFAPGATLTKTGPGTLLIQASSMDLVRLDVEQGAVSLFDSTPGTTGFTGSLVLGDARGSSARVDVRNNAIDPSSAVVVDAHCVLNLATDTTFFWGAIGGTINAPASAKVTFASFLDLFNRYGATVYLNADIDVNQLSSISMSNYNSTPTSINVSRSFLGTPGQSITLRSFGPDDPYVGIMRLHGSASTPAFPGPVTISGGATLILDRDSSSTLRYDTTVTGTGSTLVILKPNQIIQGATVRLVGGASLQLSTPANPSVSVSPLNNVSLVLSGSPGAISVAKVTTNTVTSSGRSAAPLVPVFTSISISHNGAPLGSRIYYGFLDLLTNDAIIRDTPLVDVVDMVRHWRYASNGRPGTTGIGSSASYYSSLGELTTLAVYDNTGPDTLAFFNGLPVSTSDILIKYTYLGDTDLSGIVDEKDLNTLITSLRLNLTSSGSRSGWKYGDTNYDGVIDSNDLAILLTTMRLQGAPLWQGTSSPISSPLPEPSTLALSALLLPLLSRRR